MYDKIMDAAKIIAEEMGDLKNRAIYLEAELNKEKLKKEQLKQDLCASLASYFQED